MSFDDAKPFFRHGAVIEAIMADMNGVKGDRITAGVGRMQVCEFCLTHTLTNSTANQRKIHHVRQSPLQCCSIILDINRIILYM